MLNTVSFYICEWQNPVCEVVMELKWEDGFKVKVMVEGNTVVISANREGLLSLANHMTALAQGMPGSHIHLDEYNSLEDSSVELIVEMSG